MATNTDPIEFDPNLSIPLGLKHAEYLETETIDQDTLDEITGGDFTDTEDTTDSTGDVESVSDETLDTPSYMTITSQTVRTAPDGRQVVDVVLDIEDVDGATKYDVRVTK